jgi:hypothetical protein
MNHKLHRSIYKYIPPAPYGPRGIYSISGVRWWRRNQNLSRRRQTPALSVVTDPGLDDDSHAALVNSEGRQVAVYTLEEIGRLLSAHPHIAKTKKVFPGGDRDRS